MFTLVGLLEFFYKEAPVGMRSLATSFTWISVSLGYFLSSVLVDIVNSVTKRVSPSKKGWINGLLLDNNNLNLFYWLLAVLSLINFAVYLLSAIKYKYKKEDDELLRQKWRQQLQVLPWSVQVKMSYQRVQFKKTLQWVKQPLNQMRMLKM
ncbi:unnamed protein product [Lactuca virosa]|uniref:Uncharacterized protein n=1 Tax=Lactuca virosa TaxID=75947 RepID=A0AAU9P2B2_9ASTR|nr:unnamed protein product [Lactuca virosa]